MIGAAPAKATVFDWSYTGLNGYSVTASGTLVATPLGGGAFAVTAITGTHNGVAITGLTSYAFQDNTVYTGFPQLDYPGLAFTDANGDAFNAFYDTATNDAYACGFVGYCEIGPGVVGTDGLGPPRDAEGPIAFTLTAVAEPTTWSLLLIGLGSMAGFRRYGAPNSR
jgi:hypothetical protein